MAIELKTIDATGKPVGSVQVDEAALGGMVKHRLLHQAAVMYHANLRQGTHCTKTRAEVSGSTKKLYKQKGTGRARAGNRKSGTRVGGGVIHGPKPRDYSFHMPQKQRQAALRAALLGKAKDGELHIVTGLSFEAPKTKQLVGLLASLGLAGQTVLVGTDGLKRNVHLSARNVPGVTVVPAAEVNARQALVHKHLLLEQAAFERLTAPAAHVKRARKPKGTRKAAAGTVRGAEG